MKARAGGKSFEIDENRVVQKHLVISSMSKPGKWVTTTASTVRGKGKPVSGPSHAASRSGGGFDSHSDAPAPTKYDSKWEERYAQVGHYAQVDGQPIGKPRMTRSDKWKKRACVMQYRKWADRARQDAFGSDAQRLTLEHPTVLSVTAYIQPTGKAKHAGPHTHKPDSDNIMKAVKDALFTNDQMVYRETIVKWWASETEPARVEILWTEVPGYAT